MSALFSQHMKLPKAHRLDIVRADLSDRDPSELREFADQLVERYLNDLIKGVQLLKAAGLQFVHSEPVERQAEGYEPDFDMDGMPQLLQSWFRVIKRIDLNQVLSQTVDQSSPFHGFGMFGIDVHWYATIAPASKVPKDTHCDLVQLAPGVWRFNSFRVAGPLTLVPSPCVDCIMLSSDERMLGLYSLMEGTASYGGFSSAGRAEIRHLRLAPNYLALPKEFPLPLSF